MSTSTVILTHCGKLGDFLYCLPIASWLARERGVKIHWVLAESFLPFHYITPLLCAQPFTERVSLVPHYVRDWEAGGQPYRFDPRQYGHKGEYYNLGIRHYPDQFMPAYVAQEHNFGWDPEYTLSFGGVRYVSVMEKLRGEQNEIAELVPDAEPYPMPMDLLELGRLLASARERHLWYSGPAALLYLARISFHLYWEKGHPPRHLYLNEKFFGGPLITPVEYVRRRAEEKRSEGAESVPT